MLFKAILFVALAIATPVLAGPTKNPTTCTRNETRTTVTSITDADNFCTMLTSYGAAPVAQHEGCASAYCHGTPANGAEPMPEGLILSAHFAEDENKGHVQITGCIDAAKWGLNSTDEGGQMDSHGFPYTCKGYKKFVSLLEPSTNTFCIRCCKDDNRSDCNTKGISTKGCMAIVPGKYTMADGSACKASQEPSVTPSDPNPATVTISAVVTTTTTAAANITASAAPMTTIAANVTSTSTPVPEASQTLSANATATEGTATEGTIQPSILPMNMAAMASSSWSMQLVASVAALAFSAALAF
ncbi:hypothetical protein BG011_006301 [Mortierella polycephala]|uniref:Secreted protein n=1 Tax=Mortierella polycephala TaxID=41804 RepID=A0A9P6TZS6_9FUNG|nr:hypothetical protein BG011_006301 [Mortierella polycephala]